MLILKSLLKLFENKYFVYFFSDEMFEPYFVTTANIYYLLYLHIKKTISLLNEPNETNKVNIKIPTENQMKSLKNLHIPVTNIPNNNNLRYSKLKKCNYKIENSLYTLLTSKNNIISELQTLKDLINNLLNNTYVQDNINKIANYCANYIAQVSKVKNNNNTNTNNSIDKLSKMKMDDSMVSSKQLVIGHFNQILDITFTKKNRESIRFYTGAQLISNSSLWDTKIDTSIRILFNMSYNKLMVLSASRTNLLFPVRLYLTKGINELIHYKIPVRNINTMLLNDLLGIFFIKSNNEPLYIFNRDTPLRGRYTGIKLSVYITDYRLLPVEFGMFKPEYTLTYDEVNILSKYLKMNVYKLMNDTRYNIYLFSYLNIEEDTVTMDPIFKKLFNIDDDKLETISKSITDDGLRSISKISNFRTLGRMTIENVIHDSPNKFLYKHMGMNAGSRNIPEINYSKLINSKYNNYSDNLLSIRIMYTIYKKSIISIRQYSYLHYPYSIYTNCIKENKLIKFDKIKYKNINIYGCWKTLMYIDIIKTYLLKNNMIDMLVLDVNSYIIKNTAYILSINNPNIYFNLNIFYFNSYTRNAPCSVVAEHRYVPNKMKKKKYIVKSNSTLNIPETTNFKFNETYTDNKCNYKFLNINKKYKFIVCLISDLSKLCKYDILTTEYINRDIYLDELIVALLHLDKGGYILLKVDGLTSLLLNKIIYNISLLFNDFSIVAPNTGALYSGGVQHVIFKSYKKNKKNIEVIDILQKLSKQFKQKNIYNSSNIEFDLNLKEIVHPDVNDIFNPTKKYLNDYTKLHNLSTKYVKYVTNISNIHLFKSI